MDKSQKRELLFLLISLVIALTGLYYFAPSITGFIITELSYADDLNLVVTANGDYTWQPENTGDIKSIKLDGRVTTYGKARVYIESNEVKYIIFDSTKLNKTLDEASPNETNLITGFAVKEEESDKEKKNKNKKPEWIYEANEFVINETTTINLSQYFVDKDNDSLIFAVSEVDGVETSINNDIVTIVPIAENDFNTTITFTASDGIDIISQTVALAVIAEKKKIETIDITEPKNETKSITQANETKTIEISLSYKSGTIYDANDNGEESINGVVDLTVEDTIFGWNVDKSRLCTRWEVYNIEDDILTTSCNGNADCCAFLGILPKRDNWNDVYYSTFGTDGAGYNNIVSAQIIYYDVNLSIENLRNEVYYSEFGNLSVKFFDEEIKFEGFCLETCSLSGLNKSIYELIFEIEDGAVLRIDKIKYKALIDVTNNPPILLKNFSTINLNKNATINLSEYFADPDGDDLTYDYYKTDNVTMLFDGDIATIMENKGIDGLRFTYITANDSESIAISNIFAINISGEKTNISEELFKPKIEVGKPVKWINRFLVNSTASSINLTLPDNSFNISVKVLDPIIQKFPDDKIKIIENNEVKDKEIYEAEKNIESINKKINILEESKLNDALKVVVDEREYYSNEIDLKLEELYDKKIEQEQELQSLNINNLISFSVIEVDSEPILFINYSLNQNEEIEISYETEAPIAIENELNSYTKQIKIVSETPYEDVIAYTKLNDVPQQSIKLYWIQNNSRILFDDVDYFDENANGLIDRIEWFIPHLSNQTFEVSITILNVQSFPTKGGNWTVAFNTTGIANLTIIASNGTTYAEKEIDDANTINDLDALELRCDSNVLEPLYIVDLGNLSLEGLEISGNVVKEIKKINNYYLSNLNSDELKILDSSNSPSFNVIKYPSKTSGFDLSLSNKENELNKDSGLSCGTVSQTTENTFSLGKSKGSVKSKSLVTNILLADLESSANLPLETPCGAIITSNPLEIRNLANLLLTFSSSKNLSVEWDCDIWDISTSGQVSSVMQSSLDMFLSQGGEILNNLFSSHATFQHLKDLPNHYSCPIESRLSMANFAVSNNILVNFDSHDTNNEKDVFKGCGKGDNPTYLNNIYQNINKINSLKENPTTHKFNNEKTLKNNHNNKINLINEKEKTGSRNQADEPEMDFSRSNDKLYKLVYKDFDDLRSWVGEIRQTRLPDKQVSSRSSWFKTQRELRLPDPAHKSINNKKTTINSKNNQNLINNNQIKNKENQIISNIANFFSIIPSAYALHIGSGTYNTIIIDGKVYALLTKEQLQEHSYSLIGVYYENYNCDNSTGYWTSKVLTTGKHTQQFTFGNLTAYAHNLAGTCSGCTEGSTCSITAPCTMKSSDCTGGICDFTLMVVDSLLNSTGLSLKITGDFNVSKIGIVNISGLRGVNGAAGEDGGNGNITNISAGFMNISGKILAKGGEGGTGTATDGGGGGNGGVIILNSTSQIIISSASEINVSGGRGGNGDTANGGDNGGRGGNASTIIMNASSIKVDGKLGIHGGRGGDAADPGGDGGNGGNLTIYATSIVNITDTVNAFGGNGGDATGSISPGDGGVGGNGGNIRLDGTNINFTITGLINVYGGNGGTANDDNDGGNAGNGGAILIKTNGDATNIEIAAINVYGGVGGEGDTVNGDDNGGTGGNAGNITLNASSVIITGTSSLYGGNGGGGLIASGAGNGGNLTVYATSIVNITGTVNAFGGNGGGTTVSSGSANGGNGGIGGNIRIEGINVNVTLTSNIEVYGGNGGQSTLGANAGDGGIGGTIIIKANGADAVNVISSGINASGGNGGNGPTNNAGDTGGSGGNAGSITIQAQNLTVQGALRANGGNGSRGDFGGDAGHAGSILIIGNTTSVSSIFLYGGKGGSSSGNNAGIGGGGNAGNLTINASKLELSSNVFLNGGYGGSSVDNGGGGGNGSYLIIYSNNTLISGKINISGASGGSGGTDNAADTAGIGGNAGTVKISAFSFENLTKINISAAGALIAEGGFSPQVASGAAAKNGGKGGEVNLTAYNVYVSGNVSTKGAIGGASTLDDGGNGGIGGNITIWSEPINITGIMNLSGGVGGAGGSGAGDTGGNGAMGGSLVLISNVTYISGSIYTLGGIGGSALINGADGLNGTTFSFYDFSTDNSSANINKGLNATRGFLKVRVKTNASVAINDVKVFANRTDTKANSGAFATLLDGVAVFGLSNDTTYNISLENVNGACEIFPEGKFLIGVANDTTVYKIERNCRTNVCTSSSTDTSCCDVSNDCVYNNRCYANTSVADVDSDSASEICNDGLWIGGPPSINKNFTKPLYPKKGDNVTFIANVTDENNNINSVNFTIINPSGAKVFNSLNGTRNSSESPHVPSETEFWNVTFNVSSYGTWLWNVSVFDADGNIVNSTTIPIILMEVNESLNATRVFPNSTVLVFGHINLSNNTNVSYTRIYAFSNEAPLFGAYLNFTDDTNDEFGNGTLFKTNISGSGGKANVTLNYTTTSLKGCVECGNMSNGQLVYNLTGNFTSKAFDTNITPAVRFDRIRWSAVLLNTSDAMGYSRKGGDMGVFYRNGSIGTNLTMTGFNQNFVLAETLRKYTLPTGWLYDDVIAVANDDTTSNVWYVFFRNGSTASVVATNLNSDLSFTTTGFYTIPKDFNTSDIVGIVIEGGPADTSAAFFRNGSYATSDSAAPYDFGTAIRAFGIASDFDIDDAIGIAYDKTNNHIAMFFRNTSYLSNTSTANFNNNIFFNEVYLTTYHSDANITESTNITLQTRASNDSNTWTPWSNLYYSNTNLSDTDALIETDWGKFIQYKAVFSTTDKYATPYLLNVTINYTLSTDAYGNYNFTFFASNTTGTYVIKINTTWQGTIPGEQSQTLTVYESTCSCPSSGDWGINCADDCVITSNCNMQGNNVYAYGTGTLTINALIYNFNRFATHGCNVVCIRQAGCFG